MSRNFVGARAGGGSQVSYKIIRKTISKGGRINEGTFRKIVSAKLSEARANMGKNGRDRPSMFGKIGQNKRRSRKAEETLEMVNKMREEKAIRKANKEVVIEVRRFINGKIDEKGRIKDITGNVVGKVNIKNGAMTDITGQYIGAYQSKSQAVVNKIEAMINRVSPYYIAQRAAQQKQKEALETLLSGGNNNSNNLDVWSRTPVDIWGRPTQVDGWGRPKTDIWGRTQTDMWGNQQVDMWGNQI